MVYYKLPQNKLDILKAPFLKAAFEVAEPYMAILRSLEKVEESEMEYSQPKEEEVCQ